MPILLIFYSIKLNSVENSQFHITYTYSINDKIKIKLETNNENQKYLRLTTSIIINNFFVSPV